MQALLKTKVHHKQQVGSNAYLLSFDCKPSFKAGQVIGVTVNENLAPRLYSIAGGENDEHLSVFFTVKADGELTPPLSEVKSGESLYITEPHGKFLHRGTPSWWIATGTGIAPFRSMYRSGVRPERLIQGARRMDEVYFAEEFNEVGQHIKCLSQEANPNGLNMRLTEYLAAQENLPLNITYYLCGNTNMVMDVRNLLIGKGVPFLNIITEIYF